MASGAELLRKVKEQIEEVDPKEVHDLTATGQVPRGSGGASPQLSNGAGDSVEVNTHAWVEALVPGRADGESVWIGADPTNSKLAGEEHVKIGHGRHYGDVAPIRGVYRGAGGTAGHEVSVRMTRLTS